MATFRIKKYEQILLKEIWPDMTAALKAQLAGDSARDILLAAEEVQQATVAIGRSFSDSGCKQRHRRLSNLLDVLSRPK